MTGREYPRIRVPQLALPLDVGKYRGTAEIPVKVGSSSPAMYKPVCSKTTEGVKHGCGDDIPAMGAESVGRGASAPMRLGIATHPRADWSVLRGFVRDVDALGFDSVCCPDHPVWSPDCFVTLAAVAAATEQVRFGTSHACVTATRW